MANVAEILHLNGAGETKKDGITLTEGQQAAFNALLRFARGETDHAMAVLEGYAGTGKTTLVGMLLAELSDITIAVAAPTNKAVRVLREKIQSAGVGVDDAPIDPGDRNRRQPRPGSVSFGSIHSFLGLQMSEREDGTQECKQARDPSIHEYALVVVDECSMIGMDLFRRIAISKRDAIVLFVGDPAQLPPVEPGENVSPTFTRVQLKAVLTEVVRQAADNPIIALSVMIRQAIEADRRVDATAMACALPPLPAKAGLVVGDAATVTQFAIWEIREGRDARVVAFTNAAVQAYNYRIHEALHGITDRPFVVDERVIVHQQCDAMQVDEDGHLAGTKTTLITSEEAVVVRVVEHRHPMWDQVPACQIVLERDSGEQVAVFIADRPSDIDQAVAQSFSEWRRLKGEADTLDAQGRHREANRKREEAKSASTKAWALRRAFAPLRHAYAITAHKSQGSTFDTAVVDLGDLAKMRSSFQFNRALYVAATRASQHLAIVA
jgi:exodeoxyribonuclease-5